MSDRSSLSKQPGTLRQFFHRMRRLVSGTQAEATKDHKVYVIINPASGQGKPFLKTMNQIFRDAGIDYEVLVTQAAGDGRRHAETAVKAGARAVAVYGGDGTVIEVAMGLSKSNIPLAILPGGTGNMMSRAFGIPLDPAAACALMVSDEIQYCQVDMGWIGETAFFQLAGIGMEAKIVEGADREAKDRLGILAYGVAALQALAEPQVARYHLTLDGTEVDVEGVSCLIFITENLPSSTLTRALGSQDHPGELDVVVLQKADLGSFLALIPTVVGGTPPSQSVVHHWHAREVTVEADPPQIVQADGELLGETPVTARIETDAVHLLVPKPAEDGEPQYTP